MIKRILISAIALVAGFTSAVAGQKNTLHFRYEIECASVGTEGTYAVYVWSYGNGNKLDLEQAGKDAVHGILFKGIPGKSGCPAQPALVKDASQQDNPFFDDFFDKNGGYRKYVSSVSHPSEVVKIKGGKKFKTTVQISKDLLRKDLENAGIIKKLGAGF